MLSIGNIEEAIEIFKLEINEEEKIGDLDWMLASIVNLLDSYVEIGNIIKANSIFRRFSNLDLTLANKSAVLQVRMGIARIFHVSGDFQMADKMLRTEIHRGIFDQSYGEHLLRDPREISYYSNLHTQVLLDLQDLNYAQEVCKPIIDLKRSHAGSDNDEAFDALTLGWLSLKKGSYTEADELMDYALIKARNSRRTTTLLKSLLGNAAVKTICKRYDEARGHLKETLRIATRCKMRLHQCDAHLEYARLALAEGNPDAALPHFKPAKQLVAACGYHRRDEEVKELEKALA